MRLVTDAAFAAPIRDQFARLLPGAQGLNLYAEHFRCFVYLYQATAVENLKKYLSTVATPCGSGLVDTARRARTIAA
jgi:hypothetical protein